MTAPRCPRCGDVFEPGTVDQTRCRPCQRDVDRRIAEDEARRSRRVFEAAKDLSGLAGSVL